VYFQFIFKSIFSYLLHIGEPKFSMREPHRMANFLAAFFTISKIPNLNLHELFSAIRILQTEQTQVYKMNRSSILAS
jgi:hypothetical protein